MAAQLGIEDTQEAQKMDQTWAVAVRFDPEQLPR